MIPQIITGLIGGIAYSLSGLANSKKREGFQFGKMLPTLLIAGIVGGIAGFTGQDYGIVAGGSMAAGITVIVEKAFKAVKEKLL